MDLLARRRRLSQAQREDRMRRGQCFYSGGANPMARQCPNRQSHLRANAAAIRAPPPVVPEDSHPESAHSENELSHVQSKALSWDKNRLLRYFLYPVYLLTRWRMVLKPIIW